MNFIIALKLLVLIILLSIVHSYLNDFEIERNALIVLYKSTNGGRWINNTNWLSDKPLDMWYGITLNELDYVQKIDLTSNNLRGHLNEELGYLSYVNDIELGYNHLTGSIPFSFANLTNIESLSIDSNYLEGSMPFLRYYNKLQGIFVHDSLISGPLELNSSYLITVYCDNNFFTGSLLPTYLIIPDLYYFNTEYNFFSGTIPSFVNSTYLDTINVDINYLTGDFPQLPDSVTNYYSMYNQISGTISHLPDSLINFHISYNEISGTLPQFAESLHTLDASYNQISGPLNIDFGKYLNFYQFSVGVNYLTGSLVDINSSSLVVYDVRYNLLTGRSPSFTNINVLNSIDLDINYITGSLPDGYDSSCRLYTFNYDDNYIEGTIPANLEYCVDIYNLGLSINYLTGTIPNELKNLNAIEYFILSQNSLSGAVSNTLINNMKSIINFEISNNKFEGMIPSAISNLRYLRTLILGDNLFSGTMPTLSTKFVAEVEISNNLLTGTIPEFLKTIWYIYAGGNYFLGNININQNFIYLISYKVDENYLTGYIPSGISMITTLTALYINANYLIGSFPSELCNLTNLKLLNINGLDMCVPSCLTRAAYSVSSYDFMRCQNDQDLALCSMIQQTDVYDVLSSTVEYITQVYESSHPINEGDNSSYFNLVNVSGAYKYVLAFDDWTDFDSGDSLRLCTDYLCKNIIISYDITEIRSIDNNEPLELLYPFFYISLFSRYLSEYFQYWGYLVTVKAYFPLIGWNCTSPPIISQSYDELTLSKYNLTLSNSYAGDVCGNINNWRGIECTFVSVTSLSLASYGISGTIPSSLYLLTALDQLYLSYNSFSGSLPESIGNLTNLQILDLSNNKLSNEIPQLLCQLTQLQYLYLQSNNLNGTIPESLAYLNESLQLISLSANQLSGKLTNDLCSLSNASIDVSGNNLICYEECWDNVNGKSLKSGDLSICAPTSYPTSQPSSPTHQPTNVNSSSKSNIVIAYFVLIAVVVIVISTYYIYRCFGSKERLLSIARKNVLEKLPIHRYILQKKSNNEILQMLRYASSTIVNEDYDGNNVIDLALEHKLNNEIITEILRLLLSMQFSDMMLSVDFQYAWVRVIQSDMYIESVQHILEVYYTLSRKLSDCLDENGRLAVNIASPLCRQAIKESLYFLRRYDFVNNIYPTHVSDTSIVYMAIDTLCNYENKKRVAIKFISNKDSYLNEIRSRIELPTEPESIIPILDSFDSSKHSHYDFEIRRRNLDKYSYCIVMPAGEKNLGNIIATERIAGKDWTQLKVITIQLALSINQLHSKQYIHGDIKPLNVIRIGNEINLIDLDACAKVGCDSYGSKYSQAYVPPEFMYRGDNGYLMNKQSIHRLRADYSQDSWSLGMLLYELYTGMSFFLKDYDDNIDIESLELLYEFDDDMKQKKLSKISDRFARNLVSLLLDKDPNKRLSMSRVLEHPFISGKSAVRLEGEEAEYDMFISYRVSSDLHHAEKINEILTTQGYKVWFDKTSLLPGKNWEEGFSDGLVKSRMLVPIISRNSLNHPTNPRSNITLLDENSPCDNVLLEYALALELKERGLLTQIYPVLIGDFDNEKHEYLDYFASGCYPKDVKNIIVKSIDKNVRSHLNRLGLGSRLTDNEGVKNIIESIFKSQGFIMLGYQDNAFMSIIKDVKTMKSTV